MPATTHPDSLFPTTPAPVPDTSHTNTQREITTPRFTPPYLRHEHLLRLHASLDLQQPLNESPTTYPSPGQSDFHFSQPVSGLGPKPDPTRLTLTLKVAILAALTFAAAAGWYQLYLFSSTPGHQEPAPPHLVPISSTAPRSPSLSIAPAHPTPPSTRQTSLGSTTLPTLLVFIHPQCSCTHATLTQLDQVLHSVQVPVQVELAIYQLPLKSKSSQTFDPAQFLHQPFRSIPDTGGSLAKRFGAATSGEILLYAANGRLLFQGGITPSRSDTTPGPSTMALTTALRSTTISHSYSRARSPNTAPAPFEVFGCPIFTLNPTAEPPA